VVGAASARELTGFALRVTLLEAGPDVGAGTSKANTAILHTGFDAKPGTLEARMVARGQELLSGFRRHTPAGALTARATVQCLAPGQRPQRAQRLVDFTGHRPSK
jgi:glycine/D-amino acid oxidase-like deaminating enzyme